jgi:hypothetical protein
MSVAFSKLKPGLVLLDIHKVRMGNTKMHQLGCWKVRVISVDPEKRTALCSWNSNPARLYHERDFKRLYLKPTKAYLAQQERQSQRVP